ncbi:multidrug efflux pump subunit AcrB [Pedobacter sp. W3I1]|uniref:efflux RND transporter permease subunit n=1 Tax=Pedobacter sp. W3I1 TaxID=3042291 RepID=UPI002788CBD7|nr:efflux RND transporter permease subunit [Pedobacter sp. W3I1]MDQ0640233.1 multidrug efflux pump subunit AcrB [Pedobacter sp. W3I1]
MKNAHTDSRPFRTIIFFFAIILLSCFCVFRLNLNISNEVKGQNLIVSFTVPGASPEETENKGTAMLENLFSQMKDLKRITSQSNSGHGIVSLTFHQGVDMAMKRFEVISLLRRIRSKLPKDVSFPIVSSDPNKLANAASKPVLTYDLFSDMPSSQIREHCELIIKKELNTVSGVSAVELYGDNPMVLIIEFNQRKMTGYQLGSIDILKSLQQSTEEFQPGKVELYGNAAYVKSKNKSLDLEKIREMKIGNSNCKISDIAKIYFQENRANSFFRVNGKNALKLEIFAQANANRLSLATTAKIAIAKLSKYIPGDCRLVMSSDESELLGKEIGITKQRALITVLVLLIFIFFAYRSWKHSLNVFITIIANFALAIIVIWAIGLNINLYSLAGISIAFGLITDHAIIVVDYCNRKFTPRMIMGIVGAAVSIIVSLGLLFLLPESDRNNINELISAIIIFIICSVFTNYYFTPALHIYLTKKYGNRQDDKNRIPSDPFRRYFFRYFKLIELLAKHKGILTIFLILSFGLPLFLLPDNLENNSVYNETLGSETFQSDILPKLNTVLGGALWRFKERTYEESSLSDTGEAHLYIRAKPRYGTTLEELNSIMIGFEDDLRSVKGITFTTHVNSTLATMEITFNSWATENEFPNQLKAFYSAKILDLSGVDWKIYGIGTGFENSNLENMPNFSIQLKGYNYANLNKEAKMVVRSLQKFKKLKNVMIDNDGAKGIFNRSYELTINSHDAQLLSVSAQKLYNTILELTDQERFSTIINIHGRAVPVVLMEERSTSFSSWNLMNTNAQLSDKQSTKIGDVGRLDTVGSTSLIEKENKEYIQVISLNYLGAKRFGDKYIEKKIKAIRDKMPTGYTINSDSRDFSQSDSIKFSFAELIIIIFIANFIIGSIIFENLKQSFLLVVISPLSCIGVFLIFGLTDLPFDQGGYGAFILVIAISISINIMIIKDFNLALARHTLDPNKIFTHILLRRGKTILLSVSGLLTSLLPYLFDKDAQVFWYSFAIGSIGGALSVIVVTFFILPVFFFTMSPIRAKCVR